MEIEVQVYGGIQLNYPYSIPNSQSNPNAFVAGPSSKLGVYTKPVDALVQLTVDYSQLIPAATIVGYSFKVKPGGVPLLDINNTTLNANVLDFVIHGGIAGRTYTITINSVGSAGGIRTHELIVNVPGDDGSPCQIVQPVLNNALTSPDGSLLVNTAPRFFVSATPPNGANVMDQWYNTTLGALYSNASNGATVNWVRIS
jgi:hypothetical protein